MRRYDTGFDRVFVFLIYVAVGLLAAITIYPFWQQVVISISPESEALRMSLHLFTAHPDFTAYDRVLKSTEVWNGVLHTLERVGIGTVITLVVTALTAYPLSKKKLPFNRTITLLILFTMIFDAGLIPNYLLIKELGLIDTVWALTLPHVFIGYYIVITRNFYRTSIPESIEESAKIDGASDFMIWFRLYLPLSVPVLATVTIWEAVYHWNEYFTAMIYVTDRSRFVLQVILRRILVENELDEFTQSIASLMRIGLIKPTDESMKAAILVCSTLPILLVYPLLQKYFVKGITLGAVKE
jgi:putative aldouronate transport system permease protein